VSSELVHSGSGTESGIATAALIPTVVTFFPHPREFFTGDRRLLLTPLDEKVRMLDQLGLKQLMLLPFNHDLANLSPHDFVKQILIDGLKAQYISVGQDFCFGRDRKGTTEDLRAIASSYGARVTIVPLHTEGGDRISSSAIRSALAAGNVSKANHLLGRPYGLSGIVIQGQQLGRTIGFPTANLEITEQKLLPRQGVYSVWLEVDGDRQAGVMNIGQRPTVGGLQQTVEVHLLDWAGDLYGRSLTVDLHDFLRPEQKFDSLDALKQQIHADCDRARRQLFQSSCDRG
jgi:riboflavin kinase/FMN adenylyltransferase